ncbi:GNAT family N-acetyltransferase [Robertmurraya korlensis]|uniref:GNAT family N-acetyltransferase n=1 Tax=Robertmurraya korlensis TaxID=519977 RepID=UPI00082443BF|nr:GNAT family N-acetyltransferase [Robertmurraya korlensis]
MEIVVLSEKDYEEAIKLSMYAFQYKVNEEDIPKRKKMLKSHDILAIKDGEKLLAKLHIIPFSIYIKEKIFHMGGIAGVSTYPEYRRHGYVKQLITEALRHMNQQQQYISFLHPFDIHFYRRFGWEIFADNKKVTVEKKDFVMLPSTHGKVIRDIAENERVHIEKVYKAYAASHSGMLVRTQDWWNDHVYCEDNIACYMNERGEYEGYLVYSVKNKEMEVIEIITKTHQAAVGLWNFICQHDSMIEKVVITTSTYDLFPFYLKQPKQKIDVQPYFMGRIVNVEEFLKSYSFLPTSEKVFIHVNDEYCKWNIGTYLLTDDSITAYKIKEDSVCTHPPKVGLQIGIGALTTILLGYKTVRDLYNLGEIMGSLEDVKKLERKIPELRPFFPDFF